MKKLFLFIDETPSSILVVIIAVLIVLSLFILIVPKTNNGYYIVQATSNQLTEHRVCINWNWWPDEIAFTSTVIEKTKNMLLFLQQTRN